MMLSSTTQPNEINLEGYQVVRSQYFSRATEPTMTLWNSAVGFSANTHDALNNCECIHIMVNEKDKCIIIKPVNSKEQDAINWNKTKNKSARIECSAFTKQLYEAWGWDNTCRFRACGMLVQSDKKIMMLFNFQHPESWRGTKMVDGR